MTISLPLLRERTEDIGQITIYHVAKLCERHQLEPKGFSPEFIETLSAYHWPGNVRELIKTLEVAVTAARSSPILFPKHLPENIRIHATQSAVRKDLPPEHLPEKATGPSGQLPSLKEFRKTAAAQAERQYLQELVMRTRNDVKEALQISKLSRSRFYELIKQYNITIPS